MKWDQIERKWGEMTARVEPPSLPLSTSPAKPSSDDVDIPSEISLAGSSGSMVSLIKEK